MAYFGGGPGGRADRAADSKRVLCRIVPKRLRPSWEAHHKKWAAKPPTFSDGLPERKRAASTFKSDGLLFAGERVSTRVSSCPISNRYRLSDLTVSKFRIVVEASRRRCRGRSVGTAPGLSGVVLPSFRPDSGPKSKISGRSLKLCRGSCGSAEKSCGPTAHPQAQPSKPARPHSDPPG
jgi:hypothetical protein